MCLAIPGKILSIQGADLMRSGKVSFSGVVKEINLAYLPEAEIGDYAIIHAGVAIAIVDPEEAKQTLLDLKTMANMETGRVNEILNQGFLPT